jgi:flagellar basal body-associated protein FliL
MADSTEIQTETTTSETVPAEKGRKSLLGRLMIPLFVLLVIGVECGVAYLYIPSAGETAAIAGVRQAAETKKQPAKEAEPAEDEANSQVEVDLGEFSVTKFQPASNSTLRIDFRLWGTVRQNDQKEFARLVEENKHRFRDQVLVIMRSAEIADLADAGLGLIKRKILDKTNRTLGKSILQAIVFSDFSFIEQ